MKSFCTLLTLLSLFCVAGNAFAQTERFELFAGYSLLRDYSGGVGHIDTAHGWNSSITTYIKPWIGITADFSGHYDGRFWYFTTLRDLTSHRGMVGPQIKLRHGRWEPFSHALFGVGRVSIETIAPFTGESHNTHFSWALGGGLDLSVSERVKIRLIQADYMRLKTPDYLIGFGREGLRASFGMVFPF